MRTKIAFLSAAATVAGLLSASAQVYSVNIVGYANRVLEGNKYSLVANPFDDGNGNQLTNIGSTLPGGSQILTWGGTTFIPFSKVGASWNGNTNLPPGTGFFVRNGKVPAGGPNPVVPTLTNTFVGSLAANSGSSITSSVPVGYNLFGSPVPFAGDLATATTGGGDTNLNIGANMTAGSQILTWNQAGQTYNPSTKVAGIWNATVTASVGDGFFLRNKNGPATNFVQKVP